MAEEGTYEYECMRAELLGVDKPDYEQFLKNKAEADAMEREKLDAEQMGETEVQGESLGRIGGRLDELNTILKSTQQKINNFTAPLSNFLRTKIGSPMQKFQTNPPENQVPQEGSSDQIPIAQEAPKFRDPDEIRREQGNSVFGKHEENMSALDGLIDKCERAEISMSRQNQQMKRVL
ncbi:uncharacterized protein LOC126738212 [Anthonomus grandis grandis]|uniref:uncharacterized protein LOC126738212 n=1 Tax=Anthonomus grandis grandis TaxID=2921223 RepID=UPI002165D50F|nr:uncharacterized protein LOC126738212 [Anthonomus grandis grandis]